MMNLPKQTSLVLTLLFIGVASFGCANVPLATMWKMRNFDPLNTDPAKLRFAVISNQQVKLSDGSTSMTLSFEAEDPAHSFSHTAIASITDHANIESLVSQLEQDQKITSFHLKPDDANALRLAQSKIRNIKNQDIPGNGSLSISVTHGCLPLKLVEQNRLVVSVFAQFDTEQGYIPMMSGVNLLAEAGDELREAWTVCEQT